MSKAIYRVTIASGKGQTLAVVLTPHPEIAKLIRKQWSLFSAGVRAAHIDCRRKKLI